MIKTRRFAITLLTMLLSVVLIAPGAVYAAKDTKTEEPIREIHNITIGKTMYCFFVTHNVVLTPEEVAGMTDEELSAAVLDEAGFYMKKANCKKKGHDAISIKTWEKKGSLFLSESDIEAIRQAEPVDGAPVKLYMDVRITTEPYDPYVKEEEEEEEESGDAENAWNEEDEEAGADEESEEEAAEEEAEEEVEEEEEEEEEKYVPTIYSTYKKVSPRLIFAVVATETDAASGEDICKDDTVPSKQDTKKKDTKKTQKTTVSTVTPEDVGDGSSEDEMLPELRTIEMADRSGKPVEETLKDGTPVTLEWEEPDNIADVANKSSIIDRIPGGYIGLAAVAVAAAAIAAVLITRRKRNEE